jgi:hypothetical protein
MAKGNGFGGVVMIWVIGLINMNKNDADSLAAQFNPKHSTTISNYRANGIVLRMQ